MEDKNTIKSLRLQNQKDYSNNNIFNLIWLDKPLILNDEINNEWRDYIRIEYSSPPMSDKFEFISSVKKELKPTQVLLNALGLKNDRGQTPIYLAFRVGNLKFIKFLLSIENIDKYLTILNNDGKNFLHGLYWEGNNYKKKSIINIFFITRLITKFHSSLFNQYMFLSQDNERPIDLLNNILKIVGIEYDAPKFTVPYFKDYNIIKNIIRFCSFIEQVNENNKKEFNFILNDTRSFDIYKMVYEQLTAKNIYNPSVCLKKKIEKILEDLERMKKDIKIPSITLKEQIDLLVNELLYIDINNGEYHHHNLAKDVRQLIANKKIQKDMESHEHEFILLSGDMFLNTSMDIKIECLLQNMKKFMDIIKENELFKSIKDEFSFKIKSQLEQCFSQYDLEKLSMICENIMAFTI